MAKQNGNGERVKSMESWGRGFRDTKFQFTKHKENPGNRLYFGLCCFDL
jgi:hypothetical protein